MHELNSNVKRTIVPRKIDGSTKKNRYFIYAKRCPRRNFDASKLHKYLFRNNMQPVSDPREADLIFIFTCGGFNYTEKCSIRTIEKSLKNKSAKVIVTGCLPKINPKLLEGYKDLYIVNPDDFERLDQLIQAETPYSECEDCSIYEGLHDLYSGNLIDRVRNNSLLTAEGRANWVNYFNQKRPQRSDGSSSFVYSNSTCKLEIARGCLGNCSYCAIKLAWPKFKSHPEEQIIEKFRSGLSENYKNFVLIAGDIGCYGLDIKTNLPSLLKKLFAVDGDYKFFFVDLNANWFVRYYSELLSVLKANPQRVAGMLIPIQSGSNRVLKLMNRNYDIDEVKKCILNLKENIPEIFLETHLLVGFPGETEEDFKESLNLVREIKFSKVEIFPYQDRPGTVASKLPGKVAEKEIKRRTRVLMQVEKAQRQSFEFSW